MIEVINDIFSVVKHMDLFIIMLMIILYLFVVPYMPTPERSKEGHDPLSTKKKRVITRNDVFGL